MCVEIRDPRFAHFEPIACALPELSVDMKRMLKVQWKEFLHWLDKKGEDANEGRSELLLRQRLEPAIQASRLASWGLEAWRC